MEFVYQMIRPVPSGGIDTGNRRAGHVPDDLYDLTGVVKHHHAHAGMVGGQRGDYTVGHHARFVGRLEFYRAPDGNVVIRVQRVVEGLVDGPPYGIIHEYYDHLPYTVMS